MYTVHVSAYLFYSQYPSHKCIHYEAFRKIIINSSVTISLNETRVPSYNYYSILIQNIFHYLRALTNSFDKILLFY